MASITVEIWCGNVVNGIAGNYAKRKKRNKKVGNTQILIGNFGIIINFSMTNILY